MNIFAYEFDESDSEKRAIAAELINKWRPSETPTETPIVFAVFSQFCIILSNIWGQTQFWYIIKKAI